jgi:hypothetical protein
MKDPGEALGGDGGSAMKVGRTKTTGKVPRGDDDNSKDETNEPMRGKEEENRKGE